MIIWLKRLLLATTVLALLASNILTLTSSAFNATLSGVMGTYLGVRTVTSSLQSRLASKERKLAKQRATTIKRKAATRRFGSRLSARTKRVAAKSLAAIPAESIPFIGIGVLIADTGYELYAACETITELDELYSDLGIAQHPPDDALLSVCNPDLPDADEVWKEVVAQADGWWGEMSNQVWR